MYGFIRTNLSGLPDLDICDVSGVMYPMIPMVSVPTFVRIDFKNFPFKRGSFVISVLALTTGNVTLLRKFDRGSTPRSNSWFPRH
jgi:hypothetical protein